MVVLSALPAVEPDAESVDELTVAREALVAVRTAMRSAPPGSVAILAAKSVELAAVVRRLEGALKPKESKLDELARRRAERIANS